ncbi:MAG: ABC transporter ATP-binding protein [Chitinivibrionales bacterium]|nr:ABC transporter ATP-binding protein [Chitinivibrionales bacterium]
MVKIEHIQKHFGSKVVLRDVCLEIRKGEVTAIIGQSGHGKSVILKLIMGLMIPDGGRILFEDKEISSPTKKSSDFFAIRRRFGMLFQGAALFDSMTVGENIAFPLREHNHTMNGEQIDQEVVRVLELVGLKGVEQVMPSELSGGMRSRVGLARAIAMKPDVMLYDEPTSALDPIMSDKINDLIIDLKEKLQMTSIVVTHDMASAYKIADSIAMLHEGMIIFHGTPAEIRASRNPHIQQFIRGQRKLYYAVEEEDAYGEQFDIEKMKKTVPQNIRRSEYNR